MKTPVSIATVVVLLIMTFLIMGATNPNRSRDESIARLRARISSMERRIERLEKRLQTSTVRPSPAPRRPSRPPRAQSLPKGSQRRQFNGMPYYLVPLGQKQSKACRPSSVKTRR
ncbi:MAG: hypothetical protein ACYS14_05670 [Planctomycetota bacterium]